jgi:hypothetical protein
MRLDYPDFWTLNETFENAQTLDDVGGRCFNRRRSAGRPAS